MCINKYWCKLCIYLNVFIYSFVPSTAKILTGKNQVVKKLVSFYRVLRAGALGWPWGMGWGGRWEGGSGWGTQVHPWLIHVNVWQKPPQYCKVIILQLKWKKKLVSFYNQTLIINQFSFSLILFLKHTQHTAYMHNMYTCIVFLSSQISLDSSEERLSLASVTDNSQISVD